LGARYYAPGFSAIAEFIAFETSPKMSPSTTTACGVSPKDVKESVTEAITAAKTIIPVLQKKDLTLLLVKNVFMLAFMINL
jgi:hypothetical protein